MDRVRSTVGAALLALVAAGSTGCAASALPPRVPPPPTHEEVQPAIVTPDDAATEPELAARGERALMEQRWQDAVDAYRLLVVAVPGSEHHADYMFDLGLALEGAQSRAEARDAFMDLARRHPVGPRARSALVRASSLDAYLEDWTALAAIGDELLARHDLDDIDRLVALGSRGLARVEVGDDIRASKDIFDALEIADQLHYGARDVLPVAVAQVRFALAELHRVRSERITFDPVPPDFVAKLEERCGELLDAQAAYALAVHSIDPHWAAMSGYRVGEMYRALHRDLVAIPPPSSTRTDKQRDFFYAVMHLRYRIFLEKGLRELDQTIALGERTSDSSAWIQRAKEAKADIDAALAEEKDRFSKMPFTEADVAAAMDVMKKRVAKPAPPAR